MNTPILWTGPFRTSLTESIAETWTMTSKLLQRLKLSRSKHNKNANNTQTTLIVGSGSSEAPDNASIARRKAGKLPVAVSILDDPKSVNRQLDSPLFSQLPGELRDIIWEYALTSYEDFNKPYPLDASYTRPGQAARSRVAVNLLLTCRAVYLETFLIPFHVNPFVIFDGHPDMVPPENPLQCTPSNLRRCSKLRPWQFANIRSVDLSVQQFMLEGGSIERASRLVGNKGRHQGLEAYGFSLAGYGSFGPAKQSLIASGDLALRPGAADVRSALIRSIFAGKKTRHLTIRMCHTDWWSWTESPEAGARNDHAALRLEPMINVTDRRETCTAMRTGYEARLSSGGHQQPDFNLDTFEEQGRWGTHFAEYWPDLQTLELVLETYGCKEEQLDAVIKCAKLWTFPLDGSQLAWNGTAESVTRWRGAREYACDSELSMEWIAELWAEAPSKRCKDDELDTQWHPHVKHQSEDGQEFVVKSLVFTRRQSFDDSEKILPMIEIVIGNQACVYSTVQEERASNRQ
ncbi:hypothetical protein F5Y16DRAFT_364972 [Xylariaceae sp. FL0255]|nr:hypothetical protein F5Y16DRAFT_364972 [Xylariaceae sp. FL0255]